MQIFLLSLNVLEDLWKSTWLSYLCTCIYLSINQSIFLSIDLSIYPSSYPAIDLFIYLSIYLSIYVSIYLFISNQIKFISLRKCRWMSHAHRHFSITNQPVALFLTYTENRWSFPFLETTDDFRLLLIWTYPGYSKPLECLHQENSYALFFFF